MTLISQMEKNIFCCSESPDRTKCTSQNQNEFTGSNIKLAIYDSKQSDKLVLWTQV